MIVGHVLFIEATSALLLTLNGVPLVQGQANNLLLELRITPLRGWFGKVDISIVLKGVARFAHRPILVPTLELRIINRLQGVVCVTEGLNFPW